MAGHDLKLLNLPADLGFVLHTAALDVVQTLHKLQLRRHRSGLGQSTKQKMIFGGGVTKQANGFVKAMPALGSDSGVRIPTVLGGGMNRPMKGSLHLKLLFVLFCMVVRASS